MQAKGTGAESGGKRSSSRRRGAKEAGAYDEENGEILVTSNYVWFHWALLSAAFASLTAIFAKIGLEGVDSDLATLIRTIIILFAIVWFVYYTGKWSDPFALRPKTWLFLTLSALATGASWLCYFRALKIGDAARVAPVDKLSEVMVAVFGVVFLGEKLSGSNWMGILFIGLGVVLLTLK